MPITYSFPVAPAERAVEALCAVITHGIAWKQAYNVDLVSIVRNGPNVDVTFSNPIPKIERDAVKVTLA